MIVNVRRRNSFEKVLYNLGTLMNQEFNERRNQSPSPPSPYLRIANIFSLCEITLPLK